MGNVYSYVRVSLASISVEPNNTVYSSIDGVLFNIDKTTLIHYPLNKDSDLYVIPDSVTSIGDSAFFRCRRLTTIVVPHNVTIIGGSAFFSCDNIKDVWYKGSENDKKNISFLADNNALLNATWHYNFCENDHIYSSDCDNQCNSCLWQRVAMGEHSYISPCHDCCDDCG